MDQKCGKPAMTGKPASGNGFQKKPLDPVKFSENPGFLEDLWLSGLAVETQQ